MNPVSTIHCKLSVRFYWFFTIRRVAFPVNGSDCALFYSSLFFEFRLRRGRITRSQWTFLNEILLPQRASLRTSAGLRYERTYFSLIYLNVFITDARILAQSWQVEFSKSFEDNLLMDIYFHLFIHRNCTGLGHFFESNRENPLILLEVTNLFLRGGIMDRGRVAFLQIRDVPVTRWRHPDTILAEIIRETEDAGGYRS